MTYVSGGSTKTMRLKVRGWGQGLARRRLTCIDMTSLAFRGSQGATTNGLLYIFKEPFYA